MEDHPLEGGNENFKVSEKAPGTEFLYSDHGHTIVGSFSDADWAGFPFDRRLITGYCVFLGGSLVS